MVMVQLLVSVWPVTLLVAAMFLAQIGTRLYQNHRLAKSGITDLDKLDGLDFERYLEILFKKLGYQVRRTPYQGDYGADLILQRGEEKTAVQAKRHRSAVGVKAVQEAVAAKEYYSCNKAMVVTNSRFTPQARTLAKANGVVLWDRNELVKRLLALKEETPVPSASPTVASTVRQATAPALVVTSPICTQCGKVVSDKVRNYCLDHATTFGGRIYCYEHQKDVRRAFSMRR